MKGARGGEMRPCTRRQALEGVLSALAPRLPRFEREAVLDRALASPGLRHAAPESAAWLALVAFARHTCTEYDALLEDGYDRDSARHFVLDDLNAALAEWGVRLTVSGDDDEAEQDRTPRA